MLSALGLAFQPLFHRFPLTRYK